MALSDYKLKIQIDGETRDLDQALDHVYGRMNGIGGAATAAFGGFIPVASAAASAVAGIGVAVAGLGLAMFTLTKNTADFGSEIYDASQKTGLGATAISSLKAAAETSGSSLEAVTKGIAKFAKEYKGTGQDLQTELGKVMEKIAKAKPGFEQLEIAQKAFGKAGGELIPMIRSFDGDLPGLIRHMEELGVTIDDKAAAQADAFGDQLDILQMQLAGTGRAIGNALMPQFIYMSGYISNWLTKNKSDVENFAGRVGTVFENLIRGFRAVVNFIRENETALRIGLAVATLGQSEIAIQGGGWFLKTVSTPRAAGGNEMSGGGGPGRTFDSDPTGGGKGKGIKPPRENDAEFRKFFQEMGFEVVRTVGGAINSGSLHPTGMAADVRSRGKSEDQIATLIAAALEKGYRLVDERKPIPGVKQTGPHLHFERTGSSTPSRFQSADMYGGVPLGYLQDLDKKRTGRIAGGAGAVSDWQNKEQSEFLNKMRANLGGLLGDESEMLAGAAADYLANEQRASDQRLDIRRSEINLAEQMLDSDLAKRYISESEHAERIGQMRIDMLNDEGDEVVALGESEENRHRLAKLDLEIATARLTKEKDIAAAVERQNAAFLEQALMMGPQKKNQRPGTLKTRGQGGKGAKGGLFDALGLDVNLIRGEADILKGTFNQIGQMGGQAIGQMAQGVGSLVENWVLYGSVGPDAIKKMTASILGGLAAEATVQAIMELARGFAALANPLTAWQAPFHFKSAAIFGMVAGGAAIAGRAIAGDSFSQGGGGGASSGSGSGNDYSNQQPYRRASNTAYMSGRDNAIARLAGAVWALEQKITGMRPGDVLAAGAKQRPGVIGQATLSDLQSSRVGGKKMAKALGLG